MSGNLKMAQHQYLWNLYSNKQVSKSGYWVDVL